MLPDPYPVPLCPSPPHATLSVPGSKSLSCRALILAALSRGPSRIEGLLRGDDTDALATGLEALGCHVSFDEAGATVDASGPLAAPSNPLNLGHGATPARFLMAVACLARGATTVDGSERLRGRPMGDMVDLLGELGVSVEALGRPGCLPMRVQGGDWSRNMLRVGRTASSQFASGLLMVGTQMAGGLELRFDAAPTSAPYLELTLAEMERWGASVQVDRSHGHIVRIQVSASPLACAHRTIPPDASSALFWASAAAILPDSAITLSGLQLADGQPDAQAILALQRMGLSVQRVETGVLLRGPRCLTSLGTLDCEDMPDAVPALAVAACFADHPTRMTGLSTLRHKESDRVATVAGELRRAGGRVRIEGDDLVIEPGMEEVGEAVTLQTWDDHRIAMAGAVLGLRRGGISIADPQCVAKSYPAFWEDHARLYADEHCGDTA